MAVQILELIISNWRRDILDRYPLYAPFFTMLLI